MNNIKVIADCACSHDGDRVVMEKMISEAARIGCEYVKFQLYDADTLNRDYPDYDRMLEQYRQTELDEKDIYFILEKCRKHHINPLFTVFNLRRAKQIHEILNLHFREVKIASPDCNNWELVDFCLKFFDRVFISTGLHYGYEIKRLMERLEPYKDKVVLMYCRSVYPYKTYNFSDLMSIEYIADNGFAVGLSDHCGDISSTIDLWDSKIQYLERHFILDRTSVAKDAAVSSTPDELAVLTSYPFPMLSEEELANREKYLTRWV